MNNCDISSQLLRISVTLQLKCTTIFPLNHPCKVTMLMVGTDDPGSMHMMASGLQIFEYSRKWCKLQALSMIHPVHDVAFVLGHYMYRLVEGGACS